MVRFDHCSLGSIFSLFFSLYNSKYSSNLFLSPLLFFLSLSLKSSLLSFSNLLSLTGQGVFVDESKPQKVLIFTHFAAPGSLHPSCMSCHFSQRLVKFSFFAFDLCNFAVFRWNFASEFHFQLFFYLGFFCTLIYVSVCCSFSSWFLYSCFIWKVCWRRSNLAAWIFFYLDIAERNGINGFVWFLFFYVMDLNCFSRGWIDGAS